MTDLLVLVALLLIIAGFFVYLRSDRRRRAAGIPTGEIIYLDTGDWRRNDHPLYSIRYQLAGKPDYLIDSGGEIIPVEVKSGRGRNVPYDSHIYQLAAYCLLIEQTFGTRPPYGLLHYSNQDIAIDYTPELEQSLIDIIREIRSASRRNQRKYLWRRLPRC